MLITSSVKEDILDNKKILLIHLSKNDLKKERVRRIGAILLEELQHALFTRDDLDIVNLICDEWQLYLTPDFFEDVLSQGRRYGISAVLATQTLENFDNRLQAILDQVGTHITFADGVKDADKLAPFYAKDPPGELRYEHIYEPEFSTHKKQVVTWEPKSAEEEYKKCVEELAALREKDYSEELKLLILYLVFSDYDTYNRTYPNLLPRDAAAYPIDASVYIAPSLYVPRWVKQLRYPLSPSTIQFACHPYIKDIELSSCRQVVSPNSRECEIYETLRQRYLTLSHKQRELIVSLSDIYHEFGYVSGYKKRKREREAEELAQMIDQYEQQRVQVYKQMAQCNVSRFYTIPSSVQSLAEKRLQFLQTTKQFDTLFAQLKGKAFFPQILIMVEIIKEEISGANFFDRFKDIIPDSLRSFTHQKLKEYETNYSTAEVPLTNHEKEEVKAFLRYLTSTLSHLLRTEKAGAFMPRLAELQSLVSVSVEGKIPPIKTIECYNKPLSEKLSKATGTQSDIKSERQEKLKSSWIYSSLHNGYWHIDRFHEIVPLVTQEWEKLCAEILAKEEAYLKRKTALERRLRELLACATVTYEEVREYKSLTLNTGEVVSPYYKMKTLSELRVGIGFSEGESMGSSARGTSRGESLGKSISISEKDVSVFRGVPGTTRSYNDMEKEKAKELLHLPDGIAYVAMRMRGDRFTPRMATKHLDTMHPRKGSLEKRHTQALENAIPYTTDARTIDEELWKRRKRFGIAPSPVVEAPLEEKSVGAHVPLHIAKRRVYSANVEEFLPSLSFDDDYLTLLYRFHYLTLKQICRLLGKTGKYDDTHVREDLNKLVDKRWITKEPITRKVEAGRVPLVYSLTDTGMKQLKGVSAGTRKGTFSDHTLQVNHALITLVLAAKQKPSIRLVGLQHERYFKQHNIQVGDRTFLEPDGFLHFQLSPPFGQENESMGVCLEIENEAEFNLELFAEKWDALYPSISKSWRVHWARVIPLFAFPEDIRKVIYTTNAIESVNMTLRKVTRNHRIFPSDEAVYKVVYLAMRNLAKKWTMPIRDWKPALNWFAIEFEGRFPR